MDVIVYGSRIFGRLVRELLPVVGHHFIGYVDDVHSGDEVLGDWEMVLDRHSPGDFGVVVAVGHRSLSARRRICERVLASGFEMPSIVHPSCEIASTARIGVGCIVQAKSILDTRVEIGDFSILFPGVNVSHDSNVGSNVYISPGAIVCGGSRIGSDSFVGAGSVIADHVTVPSSSFVKAGSVFSARSTPRRLEDR
ncbi:MAG: hypothetical protein GY895_13270 [Phycisphaera sp.]|nr:hypothetical protein [Phycisphaera sp.]